MTDKKLEAGRLGLFLLLAFALAWIPAILCNAIFGYETWFVSNKIPIFVFLFGYGPALANVITRKLTHEGWHDSMLHLNLKGHIKYYIIAVFIMAVISIPEGVFTTLVFGHGDWSDIGRGYLWQEALSRILIIFAIAPIMAFNTFGEEFGWRGYMNQKMEPLIGTAGTVIVGGIIWGVWHAELTIEGHNFGTDYPGYPFAGIGMMCLVCTFEGMILMWLTKKSGSIYPACIMHAMGNNGGKIVGQLFISGIPNDFQPTIPQNIVMSIPSYIICTIFLIFMLRDNKKKRMDSCVIQ